MTGRLFDELVVRDITEILIREAIEQKIIVEDVHFWVEDEMGDLFYEEDVG